VKHILFCVTEHFLIQEFTSKEYGRRTFSVQGFSEGMLVYQIEELIEYSKVKHSKSNCGPLDQMC
jgi:hypothetical protein